MGSCQERILNVCTRPIIDVTPELELIHFAHAGKWRKLGKNKLKENCREENNMENDIGRKKELGNN